MDLLDTFLVALAGGAWMYVLYDIVRTNRRNAQRDAEAKERAAAALELEQQEQRRLEAITASHVRKVGEIMLLLQETDNPQEARRLSAELSQAVTNLQAAGEKSRQNRVSGNAT